MMQKERWRTGKRERAITDASWQKHMSQFKQLLADKSVGVIMNGQVGEVMVYVRSL